MQVAHGWSPGSGSFGCQRAEEGLHSPPPSLRGPALHLPDARPDPEWVMKDLDALKDFAGGRSIGRSPELLARDLGLMLVFGFLVSLGVLGPSTIAAAFLIGALAVFGIRRFARRVGYPFLSVWVSLLGCFAIVAYASTAGYGASAPAAITLPLFVAVSFITGGRRFGNVMTILAVGLAVLLLGLDGMGHTFPRQAGDGRHGATHALTLVLVSCLAWVLFRSIDQAWRAAQEQYLEYVSRLTVTHEQMQQARDEALRANDTKSRFLASMSHELRTPLNAIIGYSELLLEDEAPDPEDLADDLDRIHGAAVHLLALVCDVLDMSKVDADVLHMAPVDFGLGELAQATEKRLTPLTPAHVQWTVEASSKVTVHADPLRTRQIVDNLLTNALRHARSRVELRVERTFDAARLIVEDDGEGMDHTMMLRCFLPFEKGEGSVGGTGLGLAIAHRLAALMDGTLTVSRGGLGGARFVLSLPIAAGSSGRGL